MAYIGELEVSIKADKQSLKNTTNTIKKELKKTGKDIEKNLQEGMDKGSKEGANAIKQNLEGIRNLIVGIFAVDKIVEFSKALLGLGSDLTEISSKFDVVFEGSQKVRDAFYEIAEATNRSKLDLLNYGALVGDVLKPLGLQQKEVEELSKSITKLAIDVASFNNAQDSDVLDAFVGALTGETEALKTYGIVIHEADIEQEAFRLGLAKQGEQLTKAQKALATYNLLLKNSKDAQGDAIRTASSFANQLKGLKSAIKDAFAFAGKEVAQQTAGILAQLTTFIKAYGGAIITSISRIGITIGTIIGQASKGFGQLFHTITAGTQKNMDDTQKFTYFFLKSLQVLETGIKGLILIFTTLGKVAGTVIGDIIIAFYGLKENVGLVFKSISYAGIGTFKSLVDTSKFGVSAIGEVFVGLGEAVLEVFKNIAANVGVAFKKAGNLAISALNTTIGIINKIPGVNINKLTGFSDAEFRKISLGIGKHLSNIGQGFDNLRNKISENFGGFNKQFLNLRKGLTGWNKAIKTNTLESLSDIQQDWINFGTNISKRNLEILNEIKKGGQITKQTTKDYDAGFFNIMQVLDKYKGGLDSANKKQSKVGDSAKQMEEQIKNAIQNIKSEYTDWQHKIKELARLQEELNRMNANFNEKLTTNLRELNKQIQITKNNYIKAVEEIKQKTAEKLAARGVDVKKSLEDTLKQIEEYIQKQEELKKKIFEKQAIRDRINTGYLEGKQLTGQEILEKKKKVEKELIELQKQEAEIQQKLNQLEEQKAKLLKEQQIIQQNTTGKQREEAFRQAGLTEAERIQEQAQKEIEARRQAFEEEKQKLERLRAIYQAFQQDKIITQKEYENFLQSEIFNQLSIQEQRLVMELAKERMAINEKQQMIKEAEQQIYNIQVELSNNITQLQLNNINKLKKAYTSLVAEINRAIAAQNRLNKAKHSKGFATGGYTGVGGIGEIAGVVHKGEWVAPAWMVNSIKPVFDYLEGIRKGGFKNGGYTITKNQNNHIVVNSELDLRSFLDYAKWKL